MQVISLVEKGWSGARRAAVQLTHVGGNVHHVVRGRLPPGLDEIFISLEGVTVTGISPRWYRAAVWLTLLQALWRHHATVVLVDNERAGTWVRQWFPSLRSRTLLLRDTEEAGPVLPASAP